MQSHSMHGIQRVHMHRITSCMATHGDIHATGCIILSTSRSIVSFMRLIDLLLLCGMQTVDVEVGGVTLAIVMELCRLGSFYKLIEQARKVSNLAPEVLNGVKCPSNPEEAKIKVHPHVCLAENHDCAHRHSQALINRFGCVGWAT